MFQAVATEEGLDGGLVDYFTYAFQKHKIEKELDLRIVSRMNEPHVMGKFPFFFFRPWQSRMCARERNARATPGTC